MIGLDAAQRAALQQLAVALGDTPWVLIGATALACQNDMDWRRTDDIDVVVAVALDDLPATLCRLPGWQRDPRREHRWKSVDGTREGVLAPEQARAKIARAREQSHRLYQHLGVGRVGIRAIKNLIADKQGSAAWRRDHGELLMDLVAFMRLGQIDFGTKLPSAETRFSVDDPEEPPRGAQKR